MPLTCQSPDAGALDATVVDDAIWATIHRARPRPALECLGCGLAVHAKVSSTGLRFFAHDRRSPGCPSDGESADHLTLKAELAQLARSFGWEAELEVAGDGWRADVLATLDGRRVALEAQISPMTAEIGHERTDRYAASGVEVLWVATRDAPWLYAVPSAKVEGEPGSRTVTRGCARLVDESYFWQQAPGFGFRGLIGSVLSGILVVEPVDYLEETLVRGSRTIHRSHRDSVAWVKATDRVKAAARAARDEAEAERERARAVERERDRLDHQARIHALSERQQRILPAVMEVARTETGLAAWAGGDPRWHAADAEWDLKHGMGIPVWVGRSGPERVWGVVCPVASRVQGVVRSRLRDLRVFAATAQEAGKIALNLNGTHPVQVVFPSQD